MQHASSSQSREGTESTGRSRGGAAESTDRATAVRSSLQSVKGKGGQQGRQITSILVHAGLSMHSAQDSMRSSRQGASFISPDPMQGSAKSHVAYAASVNVSSVTWVRRQQRDSASSATALNTGSQASGTGPLCSAHAEWPKRTAPAHASHAAHAETGYTRLLTSPLASHPLQSVSVTQTCNTPSSSMSNLTPLASVDFQTKTAVGQLGVGGLGSWAQPRYPCEGGTAPPAEAGTPPCQTWNSHQSAEWQAQSDGLPASPHAPSTHVQASSHTLASSPHLVRHSSAWPEGSSISPPDHSCSPVHQTSSLPNHTVSPPNHTTSPLDHATSPLDHASSPPDHASQSGGGDILSEPGSCSSSVTPVSRRGARRQPLHHTSPPQSPHNQQDGSSSTHSPCDQQMGNYSMSESNSASPAQGLAFSAPSPPPHQGGSSSAFSIPLPAASQQGPSATPTTQLGFPATSISQQGFPATSTSQQGHPAPLPPPSQQRKSSGAVALVPSLEFASMTAQAPLGPLTRRCVERLFTFYLWVLVSGLKILGPLTRRYVAIGQFVDSFLFKRLLLADTEFQERFRGRRMCARI